MYCNYSKDKHGNEVIFIIPGWVDDQMVDLYINDFNAAAKRATFTEEPCARWFISLYNSEMDYLDLLQKGWKPQQAREVLNNACKTELIMTGFTSQWKEFFKLRTAESAHPSARELAIPLQEEFIKLGYA